MTHQSVTAPLEIYQLHILLLKISPAIWRRIQVRSDSTLADLHRVIQLAMGWEDEHLNRFFIHAHEYAVLKPGGGWGGDEAAGVKLKDLRLRKGERFVYQYDFEANWLHQIRLEQNKSWYWKCVKVKVRFTPFARQALGSLHPKDVVGLGLLWI